MDHSSADRFGVAVRARRAELGITMEQLAAASGVSRGTLSRIETNTLSTSLANAVAIAEALGCDLSDLLAPPAVTIVRAGESQTYTDSGGIERTALARPAPGIEIVQFRVPVGAVSSTFAPHSDRTTETIHMISGRLECRIDGEAYALDEGDTLTIRADAFHSFANLGPGPCTLQMTIINPR